MEPKMGHDLAGFRFVIVHHASCTVSGIDEQVTSRELGDPTTRQRLYSTDKHLVEEAVKAIGQWEGGEIRLYQLVALEHIETGELFRSPHFDSFEKLQALGEQSQKSWIKWSPFFSRSIEPEDAVA